MKAKQVQKSDFDVKKWGIFALFVLALVAALLLLLKPADEERARLELERARIENRKARELALKSNQPQDLAAVDMSTEALDKANALFIESEFSEAIVEARRAIVKAGEVSGNDESGPLDARIRLLETVGNVQVRKRGASSFIGLNRKSQIDLGDELRADQAGACTIGDQGGTQITVLPTSQVTLEEDPEQTARGKLGLVLSGGGVVLKTAGGKDKLRLSHNGSKALVYNETSAEIRALNGSQLEVKVRAGRVDALAKGRTVVVVAGQKLVFSGESTQGEAKPVLEAPRLISPLDSSKLAPNTNGFAPVVIVWEPVPNAAVYRFELSGDPLMVFHNEEKPRCSSTQVTLTDLGPGTYFWRATAVAEDGSLGLMPEPLRFDVTSPENQTRLEGGQPPKLDIDRAVVQGQMAIIHGVTNVDATVKLNGEMALVDKETGAFNHVLKLPGSGEHIVNIVAQRSNGSIASKNLTIQIKD